MKNWAKSKLNEICKIGDGNHSSNYPKSNEMVSEGVPFIRANNMVNGTVIRTDLKFITTQKHEMLKKGHLKTGDILFTNRGEIGKIAILGSDFKNANLNSQIAWFRCLERIDNRFLFYFLSSPSMQNHYSVEKNGAALQQFTIRQINEIEIPLPTLQEQQCIIAILDEAFAAIAKAKVNAEQNLKNAKELFDCVLENILYDKKWEVRELGEVCLKVEYGSSTKSTTKGKLPVLRMGNIQNNRFTWDSLVYSDNEKDNKQYLLKHNDVLFNRTNSPELVGKTAIYKSEMPAIFAGYLIRIHRKENLLDADYLNYYLNSKMANDYGKTVVISSVNQANINGTKLKTYPIPLPTLKEQQNIVQQLDALSVETQKLEAIYTQKINDLEELKKSILQKAFSGELKTEKEVV